MSQVYKDIIRLTIDLKTGVEETILPIKQSDNLSRVLRCQLKNNNKPINLKGSQLILYVVKADKTLSMINGVINQAKVGLVDFELTEQSLALVDEIQCEIVKIDGNNVKLSFPIFKVKIEDSIYDEGLIESQHEFSALTALISNVAGWDNKFTTMYEDLETKLDSEIAKTNAQLSEKADKESLNQTNNIISQKVDKIYVDNEIAKKLSGSPKGSYPTLQALQNAYPTGTDGIYLVQDDGNIYSWSGSIWVSLGQYLSNLSNAEQLGLINSNFYSTNVDDGLNEVVDTMGLIKATGDKTTVIDKSNLMLLEDIKNNTLLEYSIKNENTNSKMYVNKIRLFSKNVFNKNTVITGNYIDHTDGVMKSASTQSSSDFIELYKSGKIAFGSIKGVKFSRVVFYDVNKLFISGFFVSSLTNANVVNIPVDAKYVRVSADINTSTVDIWQVEYGEKLGDYTSYKSDEFTFDTPISLISLSNLGSDVLYSDGRVEVKYLETVLNNSLNWYEGTGGTNVYSFYLTNWCTPNNALDGTRNSGKATNSDGDFPIGLSDGTTRGINLLANGNLMLYIEKTLIDSLSGDDVLAKFKNYLSTKPIQLMYKTKNNLTKKVKIKEFLVDDKSSVNIVTDLTPTIEYTIQKKEVKEEKKDYIQLEYAGQIHKGGYYYTSFGGGVMVNGKEYHIFRCAPKHTTTNGDYGCVVAYIKDRSNNWTTKNLGNLGLTGGEFRDINLSLPYDGSNDIILSGAFYTGVGYNYRNYVFRLSEDLEVKWYEEIVGSEGLFSWGNYLFSPTGIALKCAYDQNFGGTNRGVFLFRKTNSESNTYESIQLFPPSTVNPNECSIGYHGDKLFCIVRQRADYSLYRETSDLSGATGWSEPVKLSFKAHAPNVPCYTPKDKPLILTFSSVTDELVPQDIRNHRDVSITATFDGVKWHKEKIMVENNHYGGYNTFVKNSDGYGMCYYDDYDSTKTNYKDGTDLFYKQIYVEQYLTELTFMEWEYKNNLGTIV